MVQKIKKPLPGTPASIVDGAGPLLVRTQTLTWNASVGRAEKEVARRTEGDTIQEVGCIYKRDDGLYDWRCGATFGNKAFSAAEAKSAVLRVHSLRTAIEEIVNNSTWLVVSPDVYRHAFGPIAVTLYRTGGVKRSWWAWRLVAPNITLEGTIEQDLNTAKAHLKGIVDSVSDLLVATANKSPAKAKSRTPPPEHDPEEE